MACGTIVLHMYRQAYRRYIICRIRVFRGAGSSLIWTGDAVGRSTRLDSVELANALLEVPRDLPQSRRWDSSLGLRSSPAGWAGCLGLTIIDAGVLTHGVLTPASVRHQEISSR